jgi:hypothetical protein
MADPTDNLGGLIQISRAHQCNFLVLPLEADDREAMTYGGYEVLYEDETYVLYHDTGAAEEEETDEAAEETETIGEAE